MRLLNAARVTALLLFIALISPGWVIPAHAAAGIISYGPSGNVAGATCGASNVGFDYSILMTNNDDGFNWDYVIAVAVDGNGKLLTPSTLSLPVGMPLAGTWYVSLAGITARPVTVKYIDTDKTYNPASGPVLASFTVDPATFAPSCLSLPLVTAAAPTTFNGPVPQLTDGRLNNRASDAAQTAAIYCAADGGVIIWSVSDGVGTFAFTASKAEIDKVPTNPDKNTLIKEAKHIALYRLHGGKLQVNGPDGYVFIWDGC